MVVSQTKAYLLIKTLIMEENLITDRDEILASIIKTTARMVYYTYNDEKPVDISVLADILRGENLNTYLTIGGELILYPKTNNLKSRVVTVKEVDEDGYVFEQYKVTL